MILYLAGGINQCSDDEAMGWREQFKSMLPEHRYLDPMDRDYRGKEDENVSAIVRGDMTDILASDVIVAYCPRPSWGTAMEIRFAYQNGRKVIAIVPEGTPVSPWLRYHAREVVAGLAEAKIAVEELGQERFCRTCGGRKAVV